MQVSNVVCGLGEGLGMCDCAKTFSLLDFSPLKKLIKCSNDIRAKQRYSQNQRLGQE